MRANSTRQPFSISARPFGAARCDLPPPGGLNMMRFAPFSSQLSPEHSAITCAREIIGTASKAKLHGAADEQVEAIIMEPQPQPVADQPRGHGVEHLPRREAAGRGDGDDGLLVIAGPPIGQVLQCRALGIDARAVAAVLAADDVVDEVAIGRKSVESNEPRIRKASWTAALRWPWELSIPPFSCAMPRLQNSRLTMTWCQTPDDGVL